MRIARWLPRNSAQATLGGDVGDKPVEAAVAITLPLPQVSLPDLPVVDNAMRFNATPEVARDLAVRRLHGRESVIPVVSASAVVDRAGSIG